MHRLFVGLRPPAAMRAHLLSVMGGIAGARWQRDDQLHITLKFIGAVDHNQAEDIAAALGSIRFAAFDLAVEGVGAFEKRGLIHTLYAGITPEDPVTALHKKVEQACLSAGVPLEERAFAPHITLARMNRSTSSIAGFIEAQGGLCSPPARFDHFYLYESHMGHGGSIYDPVARYPLEDA